MSRKLELGPPIRGPIAKALKAMELDVVDLDTVPSVKRHFTRIAGRARSTKIILDQELRERADRILHSMDEQLEGLTPSERKVHLAMAGFVEEDFQMCKDVVANPWKWERSIPKVDMLYEALSAYGTRTPFSPDDEAYTLALKEVELAFGRRHGESALGTNVLVEGGIPFRGDKSSGFPLMRKKDADEARAIAEAKRLLRGSKRPAPAIAGVRIQQKPNGSKTRLVFMYPMEMTLLEGMFAPQVIDRVKERVSQVTYAEGPEDIGRMINTVRHARWIVETDFSGFDSSIGSRLIRDCFHVLEGLFDLSGENRVAWDRMVEYFDRTPILMPNGTVYLAEGGVPSGSWFTNIIDSMVNYLSVKYAEFRLSLRPFEVAVLGDDALLGSETRVDLADLSSVAAELGLNMSAEKSRNVDNSFGPRPVDLLGRPYYLGHFWYGNTWLRPLHVTLARLIYHERYVDMDAEILRRTRLLSHGMDNQMASTLVLRLATDDPLADFSGMDLQRCEIVTVLAADGLLDGSNLPVVTGYQELLSSMGFEVSFQPTYVSWTRNMVVGFPYPASV